jgi:hypothetical protein
MRSGVITVTPHEFKVFCRWYYQMQALKDCDFSFVTDSITKIPNVINFRPAVL